MYLKNITLLLIISLIGSFSIRIFGTIFPQIFQNIVVVKLVILANIFFTISNILFWIVFYYEYAITKKSTLKTACLLAIIGSFAVSILYLKKIPFAFDMKVQLPLILMNPYVDALLPFVGSVFHLIFFIILKGSITYEEKRVLGRSILSIIVGTCIFICLHSVVLFNFIASNRFEWLNHMPRAIALGTVPLIFVAASLILIFYYRFYRFLSPTYRVAGGDLRL